MTSNRLIVIGEAPGPTEIAEMELYGLEHPPVFSPLGRSGHVIRKALSINPDLEIEWLNGYDKCPRDAKGQIRRPLKSEFDKSITIPYIRVVAIAGRNCLFVGKSVWEHIGKPTGPNIHVIAHPSFVLRFRRAQLDNYVESIQNIVRGLKSR